MCGNRQTRACHWYSELADCLTGRIMSDYHRSLTINFGPQQPAARGVLRLILELDAKS